MLENIKKNKKESKIAALRLNINKVILVNIFSFRKFFKGQYANSCFKECIQDEPPSSLLNNGTKKKFREKRRAMNIY